MSDLAALDGKYQILTKIREGGMGAIYKVRHRLLEEVRVIKVMRPQLANDAAFVERFQREARAASRLRHPNIAQIYDFSIGTDGSAYIVMEYIDGIDLRELIGKEQLPAVGLVIDIAAQALTALGFLHEKQFVHRDISPDNLMVTTGPTGEFLVKLIDLGIAKSLDSGQVVTLKGEFLGKFRYASPEHFGGTTGDMTVEPRSDLYSFGIVLYQLLTGQVPFVGKDFSSITASHLYRAPVDFDQTDVQGRLSPELRRLVLTSLEKEPGDRFASAYTMRDALLALPDAHHNQGLDLEQTLMLARTQRLQEESSGIGSTQERFNQQFPDQTTADTQLPTAAAPPQATAPVATPPASTGATLSEAATAAPAFPGATTSQTTDARHRLLFGLGALLLVVVGILAWLLWGQSPDRPDLAAEATAATGTATEPTEAADPEAPPEVVIDDPELEAGATAEVLTEMRLARDELLSLETTHPPPSDLADAWRQFLVSFGEDLPDTEEDARIRELARQRQGYWEGRAAAKQEIERARRQSPPGANRDRTLGPNRRADAERLSPEEVRNRDRVAVRTEAKPEPAPPAPRPPATAAEAREELSSRGITPSTAALEQAVDSGDGATAALLILAKPDIIPSGKPARRMLHRALERRRFDVAAALVQGGARPDDDLITSAASDGDLEVVRFLGDRRLGDLEEALEDALDADEWQTARYLVGIGVPLAGAEGEAEDMAIDLAEDGDAGGIRWLLSADPGFPPRLWRKAMNAAFENGHPEVGQMIRKSKGL